MNTLLWTFQIVLALYNIVGASYMMANHRDIASPWALRTVPSPAWILLGILQIICALGLVVPNRFKVLPNQTALSALGITVISVAGTMLFISYSGFPGMLWGVIPAIPAAFIAYKRWGKS